MRVRTGSGRSVLRRAACAAALGLAPFLVATPGRAQTVPESPAPARPAPTPDAPITPTPPDMTPAPGAPAAPVAPSSGTPTPPAPTNTAPVAPQSPSAAQNPPAAPTAPAALPPAQGTPAQGVPTPGTQTQGAPAPGTPAQGTPPAPSPAAVAPPPAATPPATPGTPATVLDTQDYDAILGKNVRSMAGEDMGRIIDVVVDRDGRPRAAIIDFGGFLGVGSRKIAVDWRAMHFNGEGKPGRAVLQLTRNQVRVSPEYKAGEPIVVLGPASPEGADQARAATPEK